MGNWCCNSAGDNDKPKAETIAGDQGKQHSLGNLPRAVIQDKPTRKQSAGYLKPKISFAKTADNTAPHTPSFVMQHTEPQYGILRNNQQHSENWKTGDFSYECADYNIAAHVKSTPTLSKKSKTVTSRY